MDLKATENKVKQLDKLLTTITQLVKKHWIILTVMSIVTIGYLIYRKPFLTPTSVNKTITDTVKVREIIDTVKLYKTEIKTDTTDEQQ